jgi:hypothetical protein
MRDTQLAARESNFTVQLLNRLEDGAPLPTPEPRTLNLNRVRIERMREGREDTG